MKGQKSEEERKTRWTNSKVSQRERRREQKSREGEGIKILG